MMVIDETSTEKERLIEAPKTEVTKDYGKFKFKRDNRNLIATHVSALKRSISRRNLIPLRPILVDVRGYIIDGQHRYQALKELELPVYYQVSQEDQQDDLITLNCISKNWSKEDYLKYYVERRFHEYEKLQKYCLQYKLPIHSLLWWTMQPGGKANTDFKKGTYVCDMTEKKINGLNKTRRFIEKAVELGHLPSNRSGHRDFHLGCKRFFCSDLIDIKRFLEKYEVYGSKIGQFVGVFHCVSYLVDIYNHNLQTFNRISIMTDGSTITLISKGKPDNEETQEEESLNLWDKQGVSHG